MALVFQYGSSCSESQINSKDRLCGDAKFVELVRTVDDFVLAFDLWSKRRNCAAWDVVSGTGSKVRGALYEEKALDLFELADRWKFLRLAGFESHPLCTEVLAEIRPNDLGKSGGLAM